MKASVLIAKIANLSTKECLPKTLINKRVIMYEPKHRSDLSHLFKLKIRKRLPTVRVNLKDGKGWQTIKGVVSFTPPVMN